MQEQQTFSVSQAAAKLGVSASYLRLAERLKVVPLARRSAGNQRRYTPDDLEDLRRRGVGTRKKALAGHGDD